MVRTSAILSHSISEEVAAPVLRCAVNNPVAAAKTNSLRISTDSHMPRTPAIHEQHLQMHALDTPCHPDTRAGCCKHVQYR
jgi:hypothetical protein